jgi:hypothetical protein
LTSTPTAPATSRSSFLQTLVCSKRGSCAQSSLVGACLLRTLKPLHVATGSGASVLRLANRSTWAQGCVPPPGGGTEQRVLVVLRWADLSTASTGRLRTRTLTASAPGLCPPGHLLTPPCFHEGSFKKGLKVGVGAEGERWGTAADVQATLRCGATWGFRWWRVRSGRKALDSAVCSTYNLGFVCENPRLTLLFRNGVPKLPEVSNQVYFLLKESRRALKVASYTASASTSGKGRELLTVRTAQPLDCFCFRFCHTAGCLPLPQKRPGTKVQRDSGVARLSHVGLNLRREGRTPGRTPCPAPTQTRPEVAEGQSLRKANPVYHRAWGLLWYTHTRCAVTDRRARQG